MLRKCHGVGSSTACIVVTLSLSLSSAVHSIPTYTSAPPRVPISNHIIASHHHPWAIQQWRSLTKTHTRTSEGRRDIHRRTECLPSRPWQWLQCRHNIQRWKQRPTQLVKQPSLTTLRSRHTNVSINVRHTQNVLLIHTLRKEHCFGIRKKVKSTKRWTTIEQHTHYKQLHSVNRSTSN